jgi:hypothetical protein
VPIPAGGVEAIRSSVNPDEPADAAPASKGMQGGST